MKTSISKKAPKTYWVKTSRTSATSRPDRDNYINGTLEDLIKYYGYTLEVGQSWNPKINTQPTTIRGLISNLQKSYEEKEGSCYSRTFVYNVKENEVPEEFKKQNEESITQESA